ncbi:MAG: hypothetical protein A2X94_05785 [Bdellovibrionales bacterium GWB1_55_8]|nr:MAG: hypothetical protein A2X94_05785 [Bdellovibrionales bacterium GWB1_55_8]
MSTEPQVGKRSKLGELRKGASGQIVAVASEEGANYTQLLEMGLLEGARIEVVHEAPFGGDPIAVRVRGALIALRRNEANHITVELSSR